MARVTIITNPECLKCGPTFYDKYRVGPMVFCSICLNMFKIVNSEVDPDSPEYKKWIKIYKGRE